MTAQEKLLAAITAFQSARHEGPIPQGVMEEFGQALKAWLKETHTNDQTLATELGVSVQTVFRWIRAANPASEGNLQLLERIVRRVRATIGGSLNLGTSARVSAREGETPILIRRIDFRWFTVVAIEPAEGESAPTNSESISTTIQAVLNGIDCRCPVVIDDVSGSSGWLSTCLTGAAIERGIPIVYSYDFTNRFAVVAYGSVKVDEASQPLKPVWRR